MDLVLIFNNNNLRSLITNSFYLLRIIRSEMEYKGVINAILASDYICNKHVKTLDTSDFTINSLCATFTRGFGFTNSIFINILRRRDF
jgi:hypothetical protein